MAEAIFGAIQSADATLNAIKTIRMVYMGIKNVNQDVKDIYMDIDSLDNVAVGVHACLSDPALVRATEKGLAQGQTIFGPLTSCFWNCNHSVERLRSIMEEFNPEDERRFGAKKIWKFARLKNKGESLAAIRQQLGTQLASLQTSISVLQLQRGLQSEERDQEAFANLQSKQMELTESLQELNSKREDVQATIKSNPDEKDEGQRIIDDAEEIRKASLRIQKAVLGELNRRVAIRKESESASPPTTESTLVASPKTEEAATSSMMRPARKPLLPVGPTFETREESGVQMAINPLQRTITQPALEVNSPPPLPHSITTPVGQLPKSTISGAELPQSGVRITSEEFETAISNAITNAEERKGNPSKPFRDEDFDAFATLLKQAGKQSWSERPRTYLVLRIISEIRSMDDFVMEGCKDIHLPYAANRLPNALSPSARQSFLDNQFLVLSPKSADLVQGGPHRHLGRSADAGFTIIALLGKGGQGVVDHIRCKLSLKEFARKRLQRQKVFSKDKDSILAFENEIHNLKRLSHRHLVHFVGSYTDPKYIGIIMEPVADTDLRKYLMRPDFPESDFATLQSFFGCLTSAMMYLHSKRCRHKDIKPGNILLKNNQVLITDFGIANDWTDADHDMTAGNPVAFTNAYAAPEVARARPRNMSADVWSMGCVFLDILTVLKGWTPEQQRTHFETEGNFSSAAWDNRVALEAWISMLEKHSDTHAKPIKWIREMTFEDPAARPTAESLYIEILEDSHTYCGTCCDADAESEVSDVDSYRGSDTEDDDVFAQTRDTAITSSSLDSPKRRPIGITSTGNTSMSATLINGGNIDTSPLPSPDNTLPMASPSISDINSMPASPFQTPNLPGSPFMPDSHRTSLTSVVRDPEGNEIRKILKNTFASGLTGLEAQILDISQRREDWQELLIQAIRPHDGTMNRYTILHPLAKFENEAMACEVLKLYLGERADVDARDFASNTPLHHASYHGKTSLVQTLLEGGARSAHTNFKSRSALDLACIKKHEEVAQLLIKRMSVEELNLKDTGGWTAMHHACASGSSSIVKALLEAGANALIADKGSCTPFWRCDDSIAEEISHFYRTWRATLPVSSPELQDANAVSSWSTCDLQRVQSDEGILKGQRAATTARELSSCPCVACVVISLVKQLPDAGPNSAQACGCAQHLKDTTETILYDVATVQSCIGTCSCKTCTEARQDCGKQSDAPQPELICQCKSCSEQNKAEWTYVVPDLVACDHYKGHNVYDKAIENALPKVCSCDACHAVKYSNAIRQLAEKNFKGSLSYRADPKFAWSHYLEQCLQIASGSEVRKRQVSSMTLDALKVLLDCSANINSTVDGFTMLHAAALSGNIAIANLLISKSADLDAEARDAETALMMALMKQDTRMLRLLLRSGAQINLKSSTRRGTHQTRKRSTILSRAFELYGQLGWMVPMILAHSPDVDIADDRDHTPLQWAIHHQSLAGVRLLIEAKASLEKSTSKPKPLFLAIEQKCPEIVKLLADSGAELHATESESSALHKAASVGHVGVLNVLMDRPEVLPDLQVRYNLDGCTPLHYLAEVTNEQIAAVGEAMIEAGASFTAEDVKGSTPLHHAAEKGSLAMAKLLVLSGAVTEAQNHAGKTPSDLANAKQHKEIVELLGGQFQKKLFGDRTTTFKMPSSMKLPRGESFTLEGGMGSKLGGMRNAWRRSKGGPS